MRLMMLFGGALGFSIGLGFGLAQQSSWPAVLWKSAIAAYAAGWLLRWWGRVWLKGLREVHQQRVATAASAQENNRKS